MNHILQKRYAKIILGIFFAAVLVFFDQFTKRLAAVHLKNAPSLPIIRDVFELSYLENRGAAFGILQGQKAFLLLVTCAALAVLAALYVRLPSEKHYFALHLVLVMLFAGAVGNFIDRCKQDYVIDFFYFKLIDFPVFNVADIYVTVSAGIFFLLVLFYYKEEDIDMLLGKKR